MSKTQARTQVRRTLLGMREEDFQAKSALVVTSLSDLLRLFLKSTPRILAYRALPSRREIAVAPPALTYPPAQLHFAPSEKNAEFPEGLYDIILVPLVGYNDAGYRLGHGGGWYDKFLSTQPQALKVGIGFDACRINFTQDSHDVPMDVVITESQRKILRKRNDFLKASDE